MLKDDERQRLVKILMLSTSDNDNEALSAIRAANSLLLKKQSTWLEFLLPSGAWETEKVDRHSYSSDGETPKIDVMLKMCELAGLTGSIHDFITSLSSQYRRKGYLTPKQIHALEKIYRNISL